MYTRRLKGNILSLLHFDFPHYYASNTGLKDEAGGGEWNRHGGAAFAGNMLPVENFRNDAPKFGYRCLMTQSQDDYVSAPNTGAFTLTSSQPFTAEIFVNFLTASAGNIFCFMAGSSEALSVSLTASRQIKVSAPSWDVSFTGASFPALSSWHHVRVTMSGGYLSLYADGALDGRSNITQSGPLQVTELRIGGASAMYDEFCLRNIDAGAGVPYAPYQLAFDITKAGGFGTGRDGDFSFTSKSAFKINAMANVQKADGVSFTTGAWFLSSHFKSINPGDEVMFLVTMKNSAGDDSLAGLYAFRNVIDRSGSKLTIDRPVTEEFDMDTALATHVVRVYKIPHLSSFSSAGAASCMGDVFAFRCTGNVDWLGGCAGDTSPVRYDSWNLTHSDLPDRMIPSRGNILIFCGGTFTAPSSSRLGSPLTGAQRQGGYGRSNTWDMPVMVGSPSTTRTGYNILIAARNLRIDSDAMAYGGHASSYFSGLCYLAGDLS